MKIPYMHKSTTKSKIYPAMHTGLGNAARDRRLVILNTINRIYG